MTATDLARASPAGWAWYASGQTWMPARHLLLIASHLAMMAAPGGPRRLCISTPPRHGKTQLVARYFAAWWLGRHPQHRVITASYSEALSLDAGAQARDDFAEFGEAVFGVTTTRRASGGNWPVMLDGRQTGGGLLAVGAGGAVTGRGADVFVVDDMVKGAAEARSPAVKEKMFAWYQSVALTRLEPDGRVVVISTRWAEDDLIGRLLEQAEKEGPAQPWTVVNLPALADGNGDPLGRQPGEALWPERYDRQDLAAIRAEAGPHVWAALYQGRPTPAEGVLFRREWFAYHAEERPGQWAWRTKGGVLRSAARDDIGVFIVADLAVSRSTHADYTALGVFALAGGGEVLMLDLLRDRIEGPDIVPALSALRSRWNADVVWMETAGFQLEMVQQARAAGLPVRELSAVRDKVSRAMPLTAAMEGGRFLVPRHAPWLDVMEGEVMAFPNGRHDDIVDVMAYAVRVRQMSRAIGQRAPAQRVPWRRATTRW